MGCHSNISHDTFPKQGSFLNRKVMVCFKYDTSNQVPGVIVRDDAEQPGVAIIALNDGRIVLTTECQYSLVPVESAPTLTTGGAAS